MPGTAPPGDLAKQAAPRGAPVMLNGAAILEDEAVAGLLDAIINIDLFAVEKAGIKGPDLGQDLTPCGHIAAARDVACDPPIRPAMTHAADPQQAAEGIVNRVLERR